MPILPLEPFLFPDNLLSDPPLPTEGERWWALHSRPRAEKSLARKFLTAGMSFFLPLYRRTGRSRGRVLTSHMPLFPSYVFLRGDEDDRLGALKTNLVVNVLTPPDQHQLHSDLVQVYRLLASGTSPAPEDNLQPGTPVEIVAGPLAGMEGKVLRHGSGWRFLIEVRFLHQGVSVEIDREMVRPLSTAPAPRGTAVLRP
ncbi:MAG: hypothetical protein L0Z62_20030 [Gemmataceae bacterium]|nr:hypothetical protein [Gemmataceae bacterium]